MSSAQIKFCGVLLAIAIFAFLCRNLILVEYDSLHLRRFVRRIATADHVVATSSSSPSVRLTFDGSAAQDIVSAVGSAGSLRMPNGEILFKFSYTVTFYRGTNLLDQIAAGSDAPIFLIAPNGIPFGSARLNTLLCAPLHEAERMMPGPVE